LTGEYSDRHSSLNCRICRTEMQHMDWFPFVIGLARYAWDREDAVPMDIYRCPKCLTVELRADEDSDVYSRIGKRRKDVERNSVRQRGLSTKECVKCKQRIPIASEECPQCGAKQPEWKTSNKALRSRK
jgi:ribosomal protein L40E